MAEIGLGAEGFSAAEHDLSQIAQTRAQVGLSGAHQRYYEAETATAEEKLRQEKALSALAASRARERTGAGVPIGGSQSSIEAFLDQQDELAQLTQDAGMPVRAGALANTTAQIRSRMAAAANAQSNQRVHEMTLLRDRLEGAVGIAAEAKTPEALARANQTYELLNGEPSPLAGLTLEQVKGIENSLVKAKDRVHNEILSEEYASRDRNRESAAAFRRRRLVQHDAEQTTRDLAEARRARGGGALDSQLVSDAVARLKISFSDIEPEEARILGLALAERAQELVRTTGRKRSEAGAKAFEEAQAAGRFKFFKPARARGAKTPAPPPGFELDPEEDEED